MEASISLFAACLHYAVLSNAVFCCRPRMNSGSKACLSNPTPNPQRGGVSKLVTGRLIISGIPPPPSPQWGGGGTGIPSVRGGGGDQ